MVATDLLDAMRAALAELEAERDERLTLAACATVPMGVRVSSTDQGRAFGDAAEIVRRALAGVAA